MKTLHLMLLKLFVPAFFLALALFMLAFELMDVFSNLWKYILNDVSFVDIGRVALLFLPKCASYSMPIALLFSSTYVLGLLYMNNELISVFGAGMSLYRFVLPLIAAGLVLSVGGFFFEEKVTIDTFKAKNSLFQELVKQTVSFSKSNVTVTSADNRFVYQVNYYNDKQGTLSGVTVIELDGDNRLLMRVDADSGRWNGENWELRNCRVFLRVGDDIFEEQVDTYDSKKLVEKPAIFRKISRKIDEMAAEDAKEYIGQLMRAGLPYEEALSEYYRKFSFATTPLIVVIIAGAIGGLFKKNVLLMSLLTSLSLVVVFYILQLIGMTLARNGYIPPLAGAWGSVILLLAVGAGLFKLARS